MKEPNLSAIILTRNEERSIASCIKSVSFADEIIVIDDNSTDGTVAIAKKEGALVYAHALTDFASQRNWACTKALGKWILFLDADECITEELQHEIKTVTAEHKL